MSDDVQVEEILQIAARERLLPRRTCPTAVLDRQSIQETLPFRDPFLFLDSVVELDMDRRLIAARYDLARADNIFRAHIPGSPVFPGVLQVEAIGQAGALLFGLLRKRAGEGPQVEWGMTHVLAARFVHRVVPGGYLEIISHVIDDGLLTIFVGQCLHDDKICSTAAIKALA